MVKLGHTYFFLDNQRCPVLTKIDIINDEILTSLESPQSTPIIAKDWYFAWYEIYDYIWQRASLQYQYIHIYYDHIVCLDYRAIVCYTDHAWLSLTNERKSVD